MSIEIVIALIVTLIALVLIDKRYADDDQHELVERRCDCFDRDDHCKGDDT